jgi:hypothetical protein
MTKNNAIISALVLIVLILAIWVYNLNQDINVKITELDKQVTHEADTRIKKESESKERSNSTTQKNIEYRNNWSKYITLLDDKNYEVHNGIARGGIKNLSVTIKNDTEYLLDEVKVRVYYILDNKSVFETSEFTFYNIAGKDLKTEPAPVSKSNPKFNCVRGTDVKLEILSITASKFSFCFPSDNGNPEDPYKCK